MDQLNEGQGKRDAILALDEVLDNDDLPVEYRDHAAATLGKIGAPDAVAELLAGLDDPAPYMRAVCAEALGDVPHTDAVAERLTEAWAHDPDERVRSTVIRVLAEQDEEAAVKLARKRLGQPVGPLGYTTKSAVKVLSDHGDASDLGRVLALAEPGVPFDPQWGALHALPDLVEKAAEGSARDGARAKASRRLESYLSDRDIRMRSAAIALLARTGDSAASAALGAFASTTRVPSLASAARDAALAIRRRDTTVAEPETAESDVQALEERLKTLEDRLQHLEDWRY
jgi:HEAT repeat protein